MANLSSLFCVLLVISTVASHPVNDDSENDGHHQSCNQVQIKTASSHEWRKIEYDDDGTCSWRIQSTTGVALYVDNVELHNSDQLLIFDGNDDTQMSEELTSASEGTYFYSSGTTVFLKFVPSSNHDDESSTLSKKKNEFEVQFKEAGSAAVQENNQAQYLFTSDAWTDLKSPDYQESYGHGHENHNKRSYSWVLRSASPQHTVAVQFQDYALSSADSFVLYDGKDESGSVVADDFQESRIYKSTGEYLFLKYQSNGNSDSNGFSMQYKSESGGESQETTTTHKASPTTTPPTTTVVTTTTVAKTTTIVAKTESVDTTTTTESYSPSEGSGKMKPGVMTVLWILLFFAIILICPLIYKLVVRCCGPPEPRRNRGDDGTRWVVTSDMNAHDNVGFHKQPGDDLPPSYDTLSVKSMDKGGYGKENEDEESTPPPSYTGSAEEEV